MRNDDLINAFQGKVTTQLICGEKMFQHVYAQIVSENNSERMAKIR